MVKGITTSIRLDPELRDQLEYASQLMHRGKTWIIQRAIEQYLAEIDTMDLVKEARKQSLLASQQDSTEFDDWESSQDDTGWR